MIEHKAATIIQKNIRMLKKVKSYKLIIKMRNAAAEMIQRNYKEFRRWRTIPRMLLNRKKFASTKVQKFIKGYLIRRDFYKNIVENKLMLNQVYFDQL